jgi:uncharacterized membrane protein
MEVSEIRLGVAIIAVFGLGVILSIINGYYIEDTGSSIPLTVYAMTAVAMAVGALLVLLFQWKISQKQMHRLLKILPEDERAIIELLLNDGKMEQTYIVAESGLSKVKVSRIIEKKPLGNTNLIKLKI